MRVYDKKMLGVIRELARLKGRQMGSLIWNSEGLKDTYKHFLA
jgi:hypothetical protein